MAVLSALAVSAPRPVDAEERPDDRWVCPVEMQIMESGLVAPTKIPDTDESIY